MNVREYTSSKIRQYRKELGLTQKELGEKIGVKHNTVSGYENGTTEPEQDLLFKIADALGVSINALFPPTTTEAYMKLTCGEESLIKKYRTLNTEGKDRVRFIVDKEYEYFQSKD